MDEFELISNQALETTKQPEIVNSDDEGSAAWICVK
jgi:hypothetical protein